MSETPRDAVEQLKQETAAQLDFAADLKAAIAQVRKNHGMLAGETPHEALQFAAEALATDFAFRLAETREEEIESAQDATSQEMSARAPLIYDDLVETIQEGVERVRDAYAATGNGVLMAAAMWRDDLHDLIDEVASGEPDDDPDSERDPDAAQSRDQEQPGMDEQSRMVRHPALTIDVPALSDDEFLDQLAEDALHVAFARLHTAIHGPYAPMDDCATELPDQVLLALYGQHGRPEDGFQIDLPNLSIDDRASVSVLACSLALLVHRVIQPLAQQTCTHLHGDGHVTSQRDAITALTLVPWIVADGLQTFTSSGNRNLVQHATTASKIAGKEIPDGIRTMRAQGSRHHH